MSDETTYHYALIRRALDELDTAETPLALEELATRLNLSTTHFQKVFSRWVGVSPKKYQQYLTLNHAKTLLRDRHTTLETAQETGLSGTGRLHDLFVSWEAMTPGEFAQSGNGLDIYWGWFDSPFGEMLAMGTDRGLCGLAFSTEMGRKAAMDDLCSRWPEAHFQESPDTLSHWVNAAIRNEETKLLLIGSPLQIKVWEALLHIPSGHVTTYSDIAQSIGSPRAVRAVGTAVGRNPISWIIPCHRALRKSGALGGYHWGLPVKRAMLAWESARSDATG